MEVKKYYALTMKEALAKVKEELGEDAVILETRSFHQGGFLGLGKKEMVEVTASNGINVLDPLPSRSYLETSPDGARFEDIVREDPKAVDSANGMYREIIQELGQIRSTVEGISRQASDNGLPKVLMEHSRGLMKSGVAEHLVKQLVDAVRRELSPQDLQNDRLVRHKLCQEMADFIPVTGPIKGAARGAKTIALVGPTGVGKTTTVAKLATQYSVEKKKKIGLITVDTYRIAAAEQLKVFADIVGLPIEVAMTPTEVKTAVEEFQDMDIVFVDTAGRSPYNEKHLVELRNLMEALGPHETHLVMSVTTHLQEIKGIIDRFASVGTDSLIFSKLDESQRHGIILSAVAYVDKPISYLTTGQVVPEDIEVASGQRIARSLVDVGSG